MLTPYKYQNRFYRKWVRPKDLYVECLAVKETDLQILTDKRLDKEFIRERILLYRRQIEAYIGKDERFLTSLKPIAVTQDAPFIVKEMAYAAKKANVGPMAAVAGAIAEMLGKDLLRKGYKDIIIENGGDIFLASTKARSIRIYAGRLKKWKGLALKIKPEDTPIGVCTSSGTIGHSLSFGCADSVVVLSRNVFLADAVATACGNLINSKSSLPKALHFASSIKGIQGVVIVFGSNLAAWGKVEFLY